MKVEITKVALATYAHIFIEVDLSKILEDKRTLKWENYRGTQILDYETTTFWHILELCEHKGEMQSIQSLRHKFSI